MDEELKQALTDLVNEYGIDGFVYLIRESMLDDDPDWFHANPGKSSWEHPKVTRYAECVEIVEKAIE